VVSYFLRYFSSTSTEQISPIPPDLSPVSIRLALLFLLLFAVLLRLRYPQLQTDPRIDQQQVRPFNLAPMPPAGLLQVIEGPARRIELEVDPVLTAALLRNSQRADALPLLAFTLERLFEERLQDKRLGLADYTRMGGVKGAACALKTRAPRPHGTTGG
jgi:hypothetical protein